jgi:hypothetical protein
MLYIVHLIGMHPNIDRMRSCNENEKLTFLASEKHKTTGPPTAVPNTSIVVGEYMCSTMYISSDLDCPL